VHQEGHGIVNSLYRAAIIGVLIAKMLQIHMNFFVRHEESLEGAIIESWDALEENDRLCRGRVRGWSG
jgi:hypothetical protein